MALPFDRMSRSAEDVAAYFSWFGEVECPPIGGYLYRELCRGVSGDPKLVELSARARTTQPPPNLLFAAVHYLLLGGDEHALREWYPELAAGEPKPVGSVFPVFRDFCLAHELAIAQLIETRRVQTNVLKRCTALLPGFSSVFARGGGKPLSLIEMGASAGLNLNWDRFAYLYPDGTTWGPPGSPVSLQCELRGEEPLPPLPGEIPVGSRCGVDLHPVDVMDDDEVLWLRALAWPDHPGRQERLTSAIGIARESPSALVEGDASVMLTELIGKAPEDATLCVYGTHTLYQFSRDALIATLSSMQAASRQRPVHFLSAEGTASPNAELFWTIYEDGRRETQRLAGCCPHGHWLEWQG
ncbi:DUF2332 domain-containing protein [Myxococcota bacterium]|nr:DUF2332 domain-containing protein [Myxococcota bacterium]